MSEKQIEPLCPLAFQLQIAASPSSANAQPPTWKPCHRQSSIQGFPPLPLHSTCTACSCRPSRACCVFALVIASQPPARGVWVGGWCPFGASCCDKAAKGRRLAPLCLWIWMDGCGILQDTRRPSDERGSEADNRCQAQWDGKLHHARTSMYDPKLYVSANGHERLRG